MEAGAQDLVQNHCFTVDLRDSKQLECSIAGLRESKQG